MAQDELTQRSKKDGKKSIFLSWTFTKDLAQFAFSFARSQRKDSVWWDGFESVVSGSTLS